jgi:tripartite-type tricarboxylate transporter receptor subunit TctC
MTVRFSRRRTLLALGALGAPSIVPFHAWSQALPDFPVSILVGFTTGDDLDHLARAVAPRLEARIGRHVRVENHPGNNGSLVGEALKKGRAGTSLIGCVASPTVEARVVERTPSFDPQADMVPLSQAGVFPMAIAICSQIDVTTLTQFVEWLKGGDKNRTRLGAAANGAFLDLYVKLVGQAFGTPLQGVAYRGGQPLLNDVKDNKIPAALVSLPSALEYHRGGKIRILATSAQTRLAFAPNLPSLLEYGRTDLMMNEWYGFFAAAGTQTPIVDIWNMHLRAVLADPEAAAEITNIGIAIKSSEPEELGARVTESLKQWRDRVTALGVRQPG